MDQHRRGKRSYATASIVTSERIVFNVKGNAVSAGRSGRFRDGIVWIKWIGTHKDYDRVDVREVEHDGELKPIRTETDYEKALPEVERLWGAQRVRARATGSRCWRR